MAKQIAFPKVSANNIGGNMQGLAFAKSAMTTGAAPQKLDLEGKRAIESIKDHNARVVEDPGAGIVTRSITLGDLWTAGKGGVPLMDVRDAELFTCRRTQARCLWKSL